MARLLFFIILLGVTSAQFNSNRAVSELNGTATLSWQIPAGRLRTGSTFLAISPAGSTAFFLRSTGAFVAFGDYDGRVNFTGNYTSRNITFTLRNISSTDAGTYTCMNTPINYAADVISDCGQMLVVLGKPTKPARPPPNTTPVYNQQVTLTCASTSTSLPQGHGLTLTYTWERDGNVVTPDRGTSYIFTVTSRDPHNYRCRADESRGLESDWSDVYTMELEYRASINKFSLNSATGLVTVSERETVTLKCQVDSNPPATIRLLNGSKELVREDNSLTVTNTWQTTCRQRGGYSCKASTSVGPVAVSDLKLAVECSPRPDETFPVKHQSASRVGGSVTLWMSVLSYQAPTYTWSRSNISSRDLSGSLSVLSDISINISLTLASLSREDFGLYSLTVSNGVGEDHMTTFVLVPRGPPDQPNNVQVREITPNSAVVSWTRGFNGGDKQHFSVSYSMDNTTWINSSNIEENEKNDDYDITISDLKAATSYMVRVIAENKFGDIGYTEAVLLETDVLGVPPDNSALIAEASGGGAALLLIAIGAGGLFMYRRNKGKKDQRNGTSSARRREDFVMQENDLYGRSPRQNNSDLVMEGNVCYASSGEVTGASGGTVGGVSDVYAVVDKKPKPAKVPADHYAQEKPKKAAKPVGKKKDKDTKGGKDQDKKKHGKGDVYENTSPGQILADADANTYANAGFVADDHKNEEAVQAPPTGRDADGCLYVGIDFGSQKPGKVIIGEQRGSYLGIAFGRVGPPPPPDSDEEKKTDTAS